jgi:hypothetical protein
VGGRRRDLDQVPGHATVLDEAFHGAYPSCRMRLPKAPHPNPPNKGKGGTRRPPPVPTSTEQAPPLPLVGRGWGWGAGDETSIRFGDMRSCWMRQFIVCAQVWHEGSPQSDQEHACNLRGGYQCSRQSDKGYLVTLFVHCRTRAVSPHRNLD